MPACSGRKCPSSFREGGRFLSIIPAPPTSPLQPLISPLPHRFWPCLPAPRLFVLHLFRASPISCHSYSPSPAPLRLPPATPTLTLPTSLSPPSDTEAPHGPPPFTVLLGAPPRPAPLQLFYGTSHSRSPSLLCPGHKKGGRNRTEARPPPKSNQSVAAASPRQVIWLSGKSPFLKVGIRTPGNTRSSPAPKRTVFRYRAALRKVHHQANKATSRRSRTDN